MPAWVLIVVIGLLVSLLSFAIWLWVQHGKLKDAVAEATRKLTETQAKLVTEQRTIVMRDAGIEALNGVINRLEQQLSERTNAYKKLAVLAESGKLCSAADIANELKRLLP